MIEIYAAMTPSQRLDRALALTDVTWRLALAGLRRQDPDADERDLQRQLATRVYGDELVRDLPRHAIAVGLTRRGAFLETIDRAGATLDKLGVEWALGGSLACSTHGEPRSAIGIEIMVDPRSFASSKLSELIQSGQCSWLDGRTLVKTELSIVREFDVSRRLLVEVDGVACRVLSRERGENSG